MKKNFLLLLTTLLTTLLFSQENKLEFGIKMGGNYTISSISEIGTIKFDNKMGFNIGVFSNLPISEKLVFRPELIYSTQGLDYEAEIADVFESPSTIKSGVNKENLLNIPLLIKFYLTEELNISLGPQVGFIINNDNRFVIEDNIISFKEAKDKINFSGNIGLGYDLTNKLDVGFRYNFGITEINGFKNSIIQLNIGYIVW